MKTMLFLLVIGLTFSGSSTWASLEACGSIVYEKSLNCDKPQLSFDISACEAQKNKQPATKVVCVKNEMIAILRTSTSIYRAVLVQNENQWSLKGRIWRAKKTTEPQVTKIDLSKNSDLKITLSSINQTENKQVDVTSTTSLPNSITENLAKDIATAEAQVTQPTPPALPNPVAVDTTPSVLNPQPPLPNIDPPMMPTSWKYQTSGWTIIEHESLENFGEGVTTPFSSTDSFSKQNDLNLIANLYLSAQKEQLQLVSILDVGEIIFGNSTTGGAQGLRSQTVKIRNLYVQEEFADSWFLKAGLWTQVSDPHSFVLNDHISGFSLINDTANQSTQIWHAIAADNKPGTISTNKDSYLGILHTQKITTNKSWSLFAVTRGTRETLTDNTDLTTSYSGQSSYTWTGFHFIDKTPDLFHIETSAIALNAKFKGDNGLTSDSNNAFLAHAKLDYDLPGQINIALDILGTSGSEGSRNNAGKKLLNKRTNYFSPTVSSYLLTIATNNGEDDGAGSLRSNSTVLARLDNDEGLNLGILTLNKSFSDKMSAYFSYGYLQSAVINTTTGSRDLGQELDLHLQYKLSKHSDLIFDWASLKPGSYFTGTEAASLIAVSYKTEF